MARAQPMVLPPDLHLLLVDLKSAKVADDQKWILKLMLKQGHIILCTLWRMLGTEQDVMDAYQTAVCRLTEKGKYAIGPNRGGYFYKTAMNAGIEILRKRKMRQNQWPKLVQAQKDRDSKRVETQTGEYVFNQKEILEQARQAIAGLPHYLRNVIILRDLTEMPYVQVAKILGIQVTTARLYRRQAVVKLAEIIGQEAKK